MAQVAHLLRFFVMACDARCTWFAAGTAAAFQVKDLMFNLSQSAAVRSRNKQVQAPPASPESHCSACAYALLAERLQSRPLVAEKRFKAEKKTFICTLGGSRTGPRPLLRTPPPPHGEQ